MAININIPSQFREYNNFGSFPATGDSKVVYVAKNNNKIYRWDGAAYVELSTDATSSWGSIQGTLSNQTDLQTALDGKVNTEVGKGLSTNDYTTTEKNKLAGIASGAEVNVNADWNATSGDAEILNKPTIPSIAGLATTSYVDSQDATKEPFITAGTTSQYYRGDKTFQTLDKTAVGLSNVDNTSDANKPVSNATQTALNAKQDTLVSGTSIKTVNSTSLLGSGDVSVGVTSVTGTSPISSSGGATPAISIATANTSTTGALTSTDWNTFNNKQNALTLTTTGTSGAATLVGATLNIPQYGGGGGEGVTATHVLFPPRSGFYYGTGIGVGTSTYTMTNGQLYLSAFIPSYNLTVNELTMQVTTALAGGLLKVVIYSDLNGVPNTKLFESATAATDTIGVKTITGFSFTFNAKTVYWVSMVANGAVIVRGITSSSAAFAPSIANSNSTQFYSSWLYNQIFASLPSTLGTPTSSNLNGTAIPYIVFRAA